MLRTPVPATLVACLLLAGCTATTMPSGLPTSPAAQEQSLSSTQAPSEPLEFSSPAEICEHVLTATGITSFIAEAGGTDPIPIEATVGLGDNGSAIVCNVKHLTVSGGVVNDVARAEANFQTAWATVLPTEELRAIGEFDGGFGYVSGEEDRYFAAYFAGLSGDIVVGVNFTGTPAEPISATREEVLGAYERLLAAFAEAAPAIAQFTGD